MTFHQFQRGWRCRCGTPESQHAWLAHSPDITKFRCQNRWTCPVHLLLPHSTSCSLVSFVILQQSLLIGLCMACRPRVLQSAGRAGAVCDARLAGVRDLPGGRLAAGDVARALAPVLAQRGAGSLPGSAWVVADHRALLWHAMSQALIQGLVQGARQARTCTQASACPALHAALEAFQAAPGQATIIELRLHVIGPGAACSTRAHAALTSRPVPQSCAAHGLDWC